MLISLYGYLGCVLALAPMAIAQRLRQNHDREAFDRYKGCTGCKTFAVIYYFLLWIVVAAESIRGAHVIDLPVGVLVLGFSFPFIVGMLVADHQACSGRSRAVPRN